MKPATALVMGAGILGLWQALALARAGIRVTLADSSATPFAAAASRIAGAMLAPYCETERREPRLLALSLRSLALWLASGIAVHHRGTVVVAAARDTAELARFSRLTSGHAALDAAALAELEPALAYRFATGLHFVDEAHVEPPVVLPQLLAAAQSAGVTAVFGPDAARVPHGSHAVVIDCTGMAGARHAPGLRGVRGEMLILESSEIALNRPVRLLHPRHPLYVVPWSGHRFMVGATVIESASDAPVTVRSTLDLLAMAVVLHPGFGEARIIGQHAAVRPAFADNMPRILTNTAANRLVVNGAYRHGYLLAPVLAEASVQLLTGGTRDPDLVHDAVPSHTAEATPI